MEDNLKRLVSEVTRINREASIEVDPNVIAYVACLQEVQKSWDYVTAGASMSSGPYSPALIATLAQFICKILHQSDTPYLATAKLQIMMEVAFKKQRGVVEKEQAEHADQADMLARSITGTPSTRSTTMQSYEKLHKLIIEYVSVKAGLERALSNDSAAEEVRAAVESVFPLSSLARFLTLDQSDRIQQIEELARITLGICLYNRHTGKGGHALQPATQTYLPQAQRLQRDLGRQAADLIVSLAALDPMQTAPGAIGVPQPDVSEVHDRAVMEAVNIASALSTFQQLSADLSAGLDATQQIDAEVEHLLLQVDDAVGVSAAVSKEVIYPLFDRLGALQTALTEELRLLVVRQRLYEEATGLLGGFTSMLPSQMKARSTGKAKVPTNPWASKLALPSPLELEAQVAADATFPDNLPVFPEGYEYIGAPSSSAEPHQVLQGASLAGFCAASILRANQAPALSPLPVPIESGEEAPSSDLAPAHDSVSPVTPSRLLMLRLIKPSLGFVKIAATGELLGFSSPEALRSFAADPNRVLASVDAAVLMQPLLAKLLGRSTLHPSLHIQAIVGIMAGPLKVDFGCQTPVHFVERNMDFSYEWNQWALRRRALALANLRGKCTHSTQSTLSHFKRDGDTQVWLPKEAQVQTKVNKGQSMPKKLQYVAGLRGSPNVKMNVIRLDLDLGQPHQH